MKLILASQSPRRRELLTMLGLSFDTVPANTDETAPADLSPADTVMAIAAQKALKIAEQHPEALVIGADTVVSLDGLLLGKPTDTRSAADMLRALSGRRHCVYTGVALAAHDRLLTRAEETDVYFRTLSDGEIAAYVSSGEPMDKAGAYGAQGLGALLIRRIEGDFFNVMGLPLCLLNDMLTEFGVTIL